MLKYLVSHEASNKMSRTIAYLLEVPSAGPEGNYSFLNTDTKEDGTFKYCEKKKHELSTFTDCPDRYNLANLLGTIESATTPTNSLRIHPKWDNSKFQYVGRSYGAGASVGIVDSSITSLENIQSYTYNDVGLAAETMCIYNQSAATELTLAQNGSGSFFPNTYKATFAFPNSNWTKIAESGGEVTDPYDEFGLVKIGYAEDIQSAFHKADIVTTLTLYDGRTHYFGLTAGANYNALDKVQCEIKYKPTSFNVTVSTSNFTIKVVPNVEQPSQQKPGRLAYRTTGTINLSTVLTTLYTSVVGEAFMNNVQNMKLRKNIAPSDNATDDMVLAAVTDSITAILDGTLVSLLSYGLVSNITASAPVEMTLAAVRIGSGGFILASAIVNCLGFVAVLMMGFWIARMDVPTFDYNHVGELAIAVREGTTRNLMENKAHGSLGAESWTARLDVSEGGRRPAVILKTAGSDFSRPVMGDGTKERGVVSTTTHDGKGYVYEELTR